MSALFSGLQPSLGVLFSVIAQMGLSGVSQAVSSQCKCVAKAEGRSGEAGYELSHWNGNSLSESGAGSLFATPSYLQPAHLPLTASPESSWALPCLSLWALGAGVGLGEDSGA